jgi:hypothetical protein
MLSDEASPHGHGLAASGLCGRGGTGPGSFGRSAIEHLDELQAKDRDVNCRLIDTGMSSCEPEPGGREGTPQRLVLASPSGVRLGTWSRFCS